MMFELLPKLRVCSTALLAVTALLLAGRIVAGDEVALPHDDLPAGRADHAAAMVDAYFGEYWKLHGVQPAPLVDDGLFLRRASLALCGVPATAEEARAFLSDPTPDKRARKVDELLGRSRYADYWAFRLRDWVIAMRDVKGQGVNTYTLYQYAREAMGENRSWARIADDLVNSQGNMVYDGEANFAIHFDAEPPELAGAAARMFLGVNIGCAQCHDHPYVDEWSQEDFWGIAAFFARTKRLQMNEGGPELEKRFPYTGRSEASVNTLVGGDLAIDGEGGEKRAIVDVDEGEVQLPNPEDPRTIAPKFLEQEGPSDPDAGSVPRRRQLVEWMTRRDNPYFARAGVNRFWLELTGRGFVPLPDGFSPIAHVAHEELLNKLAAEFAAHDYDLKWLMRTIVNSQVFQLTTGDDAHPGSDHWEFAAIQPLDGDQWHDSVLRVTGEEGRLRQLAEQAHPLFQEERNRRLNERREKLLIAERNLRENGYAARADAIADPEDTPAVVAVSFEGVDRDGLKKLRDDYQRAGRRLKETRSQARISLGPTGTSLLRMNGQLISDSLRDGAVKNQIAALPTPAQRLDAVFLHVMNRLPTAPERLALEKEVSEASEGRIADLMWALMQSTEFQTR